MSWESGFGPPTDNDLSTGQDAVSSSREDVHTHFPPLPPQSQHCFAVCFSPSPRCLIASNCEGDDVAPCEDTLTQVTSVSTASSTAATSSLRGFEGRKAQPSRAFSLIDPSSASTIVSAQPPARKHSATSIVHGVFGDDFVRRTLRSSSAASDAGPSHTCAPSDSSQLSPRSLSSIPTEIYRIIFDFLPLPDTQRCFFVCHGWYRILRPLHEQITRVMGVYAFGGYDGNDELVEVERFDPFLKTWTQVQSMPSKRCHMATIVYNRDIYVLGGRSDEERLRLADRYSPLHERWDSLCSMKSARSSLAAAAMHGRLFGFGGYNGYIEQGTAEVYDIEHDTWQYIRPLFSPRSQMASAVWDDSIYVMGGCSDNAQVSLSYVDRYIPARDEWLHLPYMQQLRQAAAGAAIDGVLYVLGGYDGLRILDTIERYDLRIGKWEDAGRMPEARVNLGAVGVENEIFVVGGFHTDKGQLTAFERFLPEKKAWFSQKSMTFKRDAVNVALWP